jgi:hypothetical protein
MPLGALIARLPLIVGAYLAASMAAGFTLTLEWVVADLLRGRSLGAPADYVVMQGTQLFAMLAAILALVPATVVIVLAETFRWRSAMFHGLAGIVASILAPFVMMPAWIAIAMGNQAPVTRPTPTGSTIPQKPFLEPPTLQGLWFLLAFAAAGAVAGVVYWSIAGRSAGTWRGVRSATLS